MTDCDPQETERAEYVRKMMAWDYFGRTMRVVAAVGHPIDQIQFLQFHAPKYCMLAPAHASAEQQYRDSVHTVASLNAE